jgi:hypothetical protein
VVAVLVLAERPVWPQRSYNAVPAAARHPPPGRCWFRLGHEPKTARLFEQVALVMGKIGLINGEAERQDHALPRTPAHSTFSARVADLGAPIEATSTI